MPDTTHDIALHYARLSGKRKAMIIIAMTELTELACNNNLKMDRYVRERIAEIALNLKEE